MSYGMWACCVAMLLPIAAIFVAGGTIGGLIGDTGLIAPLVLCVGAHFVMHRMMKKPPLAVYCGTVIATT